MRLQSSCLPYGFNALLITSPATGNAGKKGHCFMAFMITSLLCFFLFSVDITLATMTDRELVVDQHFHSNQNTRSMTVRSFDSGTTGVKWLKWSEEISPDESEQAAGGHYAIHLTFTNSSAEHDGMVQEGLQSLSASNPFMSVIRVTETQEGQLEVHLLLSGSSSAGLWLPGWKYDPRHSGFSVDTAEDAPVRSFELVEYSAEYSHTKAEDTSAEDTASFATSAMVLDDYASPDEIKPETPGYSGYDNDADDTPYPPRPGGRPLPAYLWLESDEAVLTVPGMGAEKKRQTVIFVVLQAGGNTHRKEITYEEYKMLARLGLHKSSEMLYLLFHDSEAFRQQVNALNKTLENLDLNRFMLLPYLKKIQSSLMAADDFPFIEVPEVIILTEAQARYKQSPENKSQSGSSHRSQLPGGGQGLSGGSGGTGNPGKNMGKDKDGNGGFHGRPVASVPPRITQLCERRETGDCVGDVSLYRVSGARDLYLCQMHRSQQESVDGRIDSSLAMKIHHMPVDFIARHDPEALHGVEVEDLIINKARQMQEAGQWEEALSYLTKNASDIASLYLKRHTAMLKAHHHLHHGNLASAESEYINALTCSELDPEPYIELIHFYHDQGNAGLAGALARVMLEVIADSGAWKEYQGLKKYLKSQIPDNLLPGSGSPGLQEDMYEIIRYWVKGGRMEQTINFWQPILKRYASMALPLSTNPPLDPKTLDRLLVTTVRELGLTTEQQLAYYHNLYRHSGSGFFNDALINTMLRVLQQEFNLQMAAVELAEFVYQDQLRKGREDNNFFWNARAMELLIDHNLDTHNTDRAVEIYSYFLRYTIIEHSSSDIKARMNRFAGCISRPQALDLLKSMFSYFEHWDIYISTMLESIRTIFGPQEAIGMLQEALDSEGHLLNHAKEIKLRSFLFDPVRNEPRFSEEVMRVLMRYRPLRETWEAREARRAMQKREAREARQGRRGKGVPVSARCRLF